MLLTLVLCAVAPAAAGDPDPARAGVGTFQSHGVPLLACLQGVGVGTMEYGEDGNGRWLLTLGMVGVRYDCFAALASGSITLAFADDIALSGATFTRANGCGTETWSIAPFPGAGDFLATHEYAGCGGVEYEAEWRLTVV